MDQQWLPDDVEDAEFEGESEVHSYQRALEELMHTSAQSSSRSNTQEPRSSPDCTLTALAQLGALRLNARRAFISIFDSQYHYVLAEATQTSSLTGENASEDQDPLCFGTSTILKTGAPCEYTAKLYSNTRAEKGDNKRQMVLIPDLLQDERFRQNPFVVKGPRARFYVGVPIKTSNNETIGSYCIFDDKPRDHLSDLDIKFLIDMAPVVMSHLDMLRAKVELERSQRMIAGLGSFTAGRSTLKDRYLNNVSRAVSSGFKRSHPVVAQDPTRALSNAPAARARRMHLQTSTASLPKIPAPSYAAPLTGIQSYESSLPDDTSETPGSLQEEITSENLSLLQEESLPTGVRTTFKRAAHIVRDALDVDGTLLLDASVGTFGGLVTGQSNRRGSMQSSRNSSSHATFSTTTLHPDGPPNLADDKPCLVLGKSFRHLALPGTSQTHVSSPVTEMWLRSLLTRYPQGKIWNFGEPEREAPSIVSSATGGIRDTVNRRGLRWKDRKTIQQCFPGARSVAFVGMWDSRHQRWFAGSLSWTYSPTRVLSAAAELNYLVAFGQSIMSEVSALDVRLADEAKSTFIASMSHELRTPLHGILGSSDCLQDTILDTFQQSLTNTIDVCGRTLLDTFDNLLSHAKIASLNKQQATSRSQASISNSTSLKLTDSLNFATLVEEAVETVFASQQFLRTRSGQSAEQEIESLMTSTYTGVSSRRTNKVGSVAPVTVSVCYTNPGSSRWVLHAQPDPWRRILLNLVNNALKYTEEGFVSVKLEVIPIVTEDEEDEGLSEIKLSVCDNGKGMSEAFLQSHVFSPFVQEDSLSAGTGLGLSIVKQIVTSMGGKVHAKSKKNEGTILTVTAPLVRGSNVVMVSPLYSTLQRCLESRCRLRTVRDNNPTNGPQDPVWMFSEICKGSFGINTDPISNSDSTGHIYVVAEDYLQTSTCQSRLSGICAGNTLIVLCNGMSSLRKTIISGLGSSFNGHVEYTSQPYGPNKIAKSIEPCLHHLQAVVQVRHTPSSTEVFAISSSLRISGESERDHQSLPHNQQSIVVAHLDADPDLPNMNNQRNDISDESLLVTPRPGMVRSPLSIPSTIEPGLEVGPKHGQLVNPQPVQRATVLLVDDNHINRRLLQSYMKRGKRSYTLAETGLEALEAYRLAVPADVLASESLIKDFMAYEIILMDINMPVMDGLESTRQIRSFEQEYGLRAAKIVAITGTESAQIEQEAFASGIDMFLTKPVRLKDVLCILEEG